MFGQSILDYPDNSEFKKILLENALATVDGLGLVENDIISNNEIRVHKIKYDQFYLPYRAKIEGVLEPLVNDGEAVVLRHFSPIGEAVNIFPERVAPLFAHLENQRICDAFFDKSMTATDLKKPRPDDFKGIKKTADTIIDFMQKSGCLDEFMQTLEYAEPTINLEIGYGLAESKFVVFSNIVYAPADYAGNQPDFDNYELASASSARIPGILEFEDIVNYVCRMSFGDPGGHRMKNVMRPKQDTDIKQEETDRQSVVWRFNFKDENFKDAYEIQDYRTINNDSEPETGPCAPRI